MSLQWMTFAWAEGPDDPMDRYILLKLADNADQDGHCFPSMMEICDKTRLSMSTVKRSIASLETEGWITVKRGDGRGHRSQYQIHKRDSDRTGSERTGSVRAKKGFTQNQKGFTETLSYIELSLTVKEPSRAGELDPYLATWNEHCDPLPKISSLSDKRRAKLKTRIAEGLNLEIFRRLVVTCAKTPFLRGENDRNWRADFDWLLASEDNGLKVREGKYGKAESAQKQAYRDAASLYNSPEYAAERRSA